MSNESFLSRWSKKKATADAPEITPKIAPEIAPPASQNPKQDAGFEPVSVDYAVPAETENAPLPTIESLTAESDFSPFMRQDVTPELRNQAMKKLFTDPHYNVMDRLDTYIDDYGNAEPIPESMLRMMAQSVTLGLFDHEKEDKKIAVASAPVVAPSVEATPALENAAPDVALDAVPSPVEIKSS